MCKFFFWLLVGYALLSQVLTVISTYVSTNMGWTATNALRADLARHCLSLDMPFHNARTPGEMIDQRRHRLPDLLLFQHAHESY